MLYVNPVEVGVQDHSLTTVTAVVSAASRLLPGRVVSPTPKIQI